MFVSGEQIGEIHAVFAKLDHQSPGVLPEIACQDPFQDFFNPGVFHVPMFSASVHVAFLLLCVSMITDRRKVSTHFRVNPRIWLDLRFLVRLGLASVRFYGQCHGVFHTGVPGLRILP